MCASRHGVAADGGIGVVDVVNSHAVRDGTDSACTSVVAEQSNAVNHVPVDSAADARNVSRVMRSSHRSSHSASEMTCIVSSGALNSTHSLKLSPI